MGISLANLIIILIIILLIFGAGKLPKVMGEIGKGLKNFRDNLKDADDSENYKPNVPKAISSTAKTKTTKKKIINKTKTNERRTSKKDI